MLLRFYLGVLLAQVWCSVSEIAVAADGQGGHGSLSERAHDMLRRGLKSINEDSIPQVAVHGHRGARSSGCPFAPQQSQHQSKKFIREISRQSKLARLYEETSLDLLARLPHAVGSERRVRALKDINQELASVSEMCPSEPQACNASSPYRTADGSCNNLDNPGWGKAGACMPRILDPDYGNGVNTTRVALSGRPLPNSRMISYTVHPEVIVPNLRWTHMMMQFGQFLDHDILHALVVAEASFVNNLGIPFVNLSDPGFDCCNLTLKDTPACNSVDIPEDDPFFRALNVTCLGVSTTLPCTNCQLGPRQNPNSRTSYIDASHLYGVSDEETNALRTFTGGLLLSQTNSGAGLPPGSFTPDSDQCSVPSEDKFCFQTGDGRANQHPALTALQIVWFREHNRIATELHVINPNWNDERLFQEARRIVSAETQHIVYNEWLPGILGSKVTARYELYPRKSGFTEYDASVDATTPNEFSAVAFRFGHSLTNNSFLRVYSDGREDSFDLKDNYINPFAMYNEEDLDAVIRGMAKEPFQANDRYGVHALSQFLLRPRTSPFGGDLFTIDIERGRERGIKGYSAYLELCTGKKLESFEDLENAKVMSRGNARLFADIYEDVQDIDFFSGGLAERPLQGSVLGPTFSCVVASVFRALKFGDRFYYEHGKQAGSFRKDQLKEIRKVTLSRIICDNTNIEQIQRKVFRYSQSPGSGEVPCDSIPRINLTRWADTYNN